MIDQLCPNCGPVNEDEGLLVGPLDAYCCAFCGCPETDLTPLHEAYEALERGAHPAGLDDVRKSFERRYPIPEGVFWDENDKAYLPKDIRRTSDDLNAQLWDARFEGWSECWQSQQAQGEASAILCREIGETSWFDHQPLVPGSNVHTARQQSPQWDTKPMYDAPPAPAEVPETSQKTRRGLSDAEINELTLEKLGQWPSFEAQSWACKVIHALYEAAPESHKGMIEKLASALQEAASLDFIDHEDSVAISGHGTYTIGYLLDEANILLATPPAPAAVPTKRKAGFLMTDSNGKEHFISIKRTCENADDLNGWVPVYFGNEDFPPQHEPVAVPDEYWDYDNLFYAISKATKTLNRGAVVVTVQGFKDAMRECLKEPPSTEAPEPIDDESVKRQIGELGNMLHNLSCEHQNNETLSDRLSDLATQAWRISSAASSVAPAAVPDRIEAKDASQFISEPSWLEAERFAQGFNCCIDKLAPTPAEPVSEE